MTDIRKAIAIATMLAAPFSAAANTEYTTFSTEAEFADEVDVIANDTFNDLDPGYNSNGIDRTLDGGFSYSLDATTGLWVIEIDPVTSDRNFTLVPSVSTNDLADNLEASQFSSQISAIGGYFYNTDVDFTTVTGSIELLVELAIGDALTFTLSNLTRPTFWGIEVEDDYITRFSLSALTPDAYPTVSELFFGSVYEADPVDPGTGGGADPGTGGTDPGTDPGAGGTDPGTGGGTGGGADPVSAPAPAALALLLLGLAGMAQLRRRVA
ncbi:MAG: PEP-CTERM sorting domain-containing protein [Pseudomonadales bacterium]